MDTIDLDKIDQEQGDGLTHWISYGPTAFHLRYASPRQATRFRRRMQHLGIMRREGTGFDINEGRDADYCREFSKEYVLDWKGVTKKGEPMAYSPESMGKLMHSHGGVFKLIHDAVTEDDSFFGSNGNGSMPS